jgi:hypothetical protein
MASIPAMVGEISDIDTRGGMQNFRHQYHESVRGGKKSGESNQGVKTTILPRNSKKRSISASDSEYLDQNLSYVHDFEFKKRKLEPQTSTTVDKEPFEGCVTTGEAYHPLDITASSSPPTSTHHLEDDTSQLGRHLKADGCIAGGNLYYNVLVLRDVSANNDPQHPGENEGKPRKKPMGPLTHLYLVIKLCIAVFRVHLFLCKKPSNADIFKTVGSEFLHQNFTAVGLKRIKDRLGVVRADLRLGLFREAVPQIADAMRQAGTWPNPMSTPSSRVNVWHQASQSPLLHVFYSHFSDSIDPEAIQQCQSFEAWRFFTA